jgi:hypothetical protein
MFLRDANGTFAIISDRVRMRVCSFRQASLSLSFPNECERCSSLVRSHLCHVLPTVFINSSGVKRLVHEADY